MYQQQTDLINEWAPNPPYLLSSEALSCLVASSRLDQFLAASRLATGSAEWIEKKKNDFWPPHQFAKFFSPSFWQPILVLDKWIRVVVIVTVKRKRRFCTLFFLAGKEKNQLSWYVRVNFRARSQSHCYVRTRIYTRTYVRYARMAVVCSSRKRGCRVLSLKVWKKQAWTWELADTSLTHMCVKTQMTFRSYAAITNRATH